MIDEIENVMNVKFTKAKYHKDYTIYTSAYYIITHNEINDTFIGYFVKYGKVIDGFNYSIETNSIEELKEHYHSSIAKEIENLKDELSSLIAIQSQIDKSI